MSTPDKESQTSSERQTWDLGRVWKYQDLRHTSCQASCGWFSIEAAAATGDVLATHSDSSALDTIHASGDHQEFRWDDSDILAPN